MKLASNMEAGKAEANVKSQVLTQIIYPTIEPLGGEEEVILNWEKDDDAF